MKCHVPFKFLILCTFFIKDIFLSDSIREEEKEGVSSTTSSPKKKFGITFGRNAKIEEFYCFCRIWIERIDGRTYFCGGSLIAHNQILTAAHCFFEAKKLYACCGSNSCRTTEGKCYYSENTKGAFVHKGFLHASTRGALYDDVAYIKTNGTFISPKSKPCKLCTKTSNLEGEYMTVAGCGVTETGKT